MTVPLRDVFAQPPIPLARFYESPGGVPPSLSEKSWANKYSEIKPPSLRMHSNPNFDEIQYLLGPEDEMDRILLSKAVYPLNQTREALRVEGDSVRVFYTHIAHPIHLAFQQILELRSEAGPPGHTNSKNTVDFTWTLGNQCVLVGELKRHGIIDDRTWLGQFAADSNRKRLGRELRAYCHVYRSAAVAAFDGMYMVILVFQASVEEKVRRADCPIEGYIFSYRSPLLRYFLFRVVSQQIRRCQAQTAPPLRLGEYTRQFKWWSGLPCWVDSRGTTYPDHPDGYVRCLDPRTGAWYWDTPNGAVWDTPGLW